ncbi:ribonuclease H [Sinorhizobium fredii USDA 205]|uniref:Ribonuclease H n=1 Tax=Rhizobium fredii TaxID=380 RepID=A0A844AFK9_RHIFR|nr:ribonuclease HI [Sinorhizobium fredii]KSV92660.1 ribonuclease H [Sinorhizobium fredii USDA 205]MQX10818.1 ribonuclease HI [Sinorhizobium fredii]GEC31464.1 ribonuclease H [Sinorhizobium fredii]GLS09168.1 ribonuclease H [Sinorhizobium fredii]
MQTGENTKHDAFILINTDGACSGNPGPGGWAAVLRKYEQGVERKVKRISGADPQTTNNRMEMNAAIAGLEAIKNNAHGRLIVIRSDSQLLIKGMTTWLANWKRNSWRKSDKRPVENQDLWMQLDALAEGKNLRWEWTKGHNGDAYNEEADRLASQAMRTALI